MCLIIAIHLQNSKNSRLMIIGNSRRNVGVFLFLYLWNMNNKHLLKLFAVIFLATSIPCFILWLNLPRSTNTHTIESYPVEQFIKGNETRILTIKEVNRGIDKELNQITSELGDLTDSILVKKETADTIGIIKYQDLTIQKQDDKIDRLEFKVINLDSIVDLQDQNITLLKLENKSQARTNKKMKRQRNLAFIGGGAALIFGTIQIIKK